jgi:8-oxo-dGTP pyrophosphatase MutT (NUDIX family)
MFSKKNQEPKELEMQVFANSLESEKKDSTKKVFPIYNNIYNYNSSKKNYNNNNYNKKMNRHNNHNTNLQNSPNMFIDFHESEQKSFFQDSNRNNFESNIYSKSWPFANNFYKNEKIEKKHRNIHLHNQTNNCNSDFSAKHSNYYYTLSYPSDYITDQKRKKKNCEIIPPTDNFMRNNSYNNNNKNITSTLSDNLLLLEKKSYCINCGKYGHLFKKCMYPILSFGLIGYYYEQSESCDENDIHFIMIQSKNTFHFLDFIRGKYELLDTESIKKLFENMTKSEIEMLSCKDFDIVWKETYHDIYVLNEIQENQKKISKTKFDMLVEGYMIQNVFYNLSYFLELNKNSQIEISWSFPKGRRNYKESDLMCAIREFEEETGLKRKFFEIKEPKKIYCETYVGDNNIEYQHRYFLAEFHHKIDIEFCEMNSHQIIEIGSLKWLKKNEAIRNINPFYKQRIEIVSQFIHDILENKKKVNHRKPFQKTNQSNSKNVPHFHISLNKTPMIHSFDKMDKEKIKETHHSNVLDLTKTSSICNSNIYLADNTEDYILLEN